MTNGKTIWLRHETKAKEQRVTLTPAGVRELLGAEFRVVVERSPTRVIHDDEYAAIEGVEMAETNAWRELPHDPNLLIVGLKELGSPDEHQGLNLVNKHTYFAHAYKEQEGWEKVLSQYQRGGTGLLYDYEFLWTQEDKKGNVGAVMSPFAGYVGAAQGIRAWCWQNLHPSLPLPPIVPSTKAEIEAQLTASLKEVAEQTGLKPKVMVMGAKGRCGGGAVECARAVGLETIEWDREETAGGGPFPEILEHEIFVNCILLQGKTDPFLTPEMIEEAAADRRVTVIADVSCDPSSEFNPLPVYDKITSWDAPALRIRDGGLPLDVISVDNLPSVLSMEASQAFGETLLPLLLQFPESPRWDESAAIYRRNLAKLVEP